MDDSKGIEIKAANVEAAIAEGLTQLGVSRDQVRIEVLERHRLLSQRGQKRQRNW